MIALKNPGCPTGTELAAIEGFLLYYVVKKRNIVPILIIANAEKQLKSGRRLFGILIKQIRNTGHLLLNNEASMILIKLVDRLCNK